MNELEIKFVKICKEADRRFLVRNLNVLEIVTLEEYNQYSGKKFQSWFEIDNDGLHSADEVLDHYSDRSVKFI